MAKRSSRAGTGGSRGSFGRPAGGSGRPANSSSRGSSNSRMWSQPATARQLAALKANGNHDGKFYSKGRAGQTIGDSVRAVGSAPLPWYGAGRAGWGPLTAPSPPRGDGLPASGVVEPAAVRPEVVPAPRENQAPAGPRCGHPAAGGSGVQKFFALFDQLEERHLRVLQAEFGSSAGDVLRREIKAWLTTRIDLATTNARELVRALNEQTRLASVTRPAAPLPDYDPQEAKATARRERRALPKPPRKRSAPAGKGRTYNGTVLSANPHGVVVSLDNGEQGWLHVSRLRQLNGGAWVESASDVLAVGQELRVRGVGTTSRGQVDLAIVDLRAIKRVDTKSTAPGPESLDQDKPLPAQARSAGNRWFKFGRYGEERT